MKDLLLTSSVLIAVLTLLRLLLRRRIPARLQYALWLLVAVRLLVPVQIGALPFSIVSLTDSVQIEASAEAAPSAERNRNVGDTTRQALRPEISPDAPKSSRGEQAPTASAQDFTPATKRGISLRSALPYIWLGGIVCMAAGLLATNLSLRRRLRRSAAPVCCEETALPVYVSGALASPCLIGLVSPKIYLTPACTENNARRRHVLAHELTHYRHKDHLWSLLRCLLLCIYWFDPFVWLAAILSKRDCELACDEGAISRLGESERLTYGKTLVDMVALASRPLTLLQTATTMYESTRHLKERVKRIVKKPKTWIFAVVCLLLLLTAAVGCTFGGKKDATPDSSKEASTQPTSISAATQPQDDREFVRSIWEQGDCVIPQLTLPGADVERINQEIRDALGADEILQGGSCPYQSITYQTPMHNDCLSLVIRVNDDGVAAERILAYTLFLQTDESTGEPLADAEPSYPSYDALWDRAGIYLVKQDAADSSSAAFKLSNHQEVIMRAVGQRFCALLARAEDDKPDRILTDENYALFKHSTDWSEQNGLQYYIGADGALHVVAKLQEAPGSDHCYIDADVQNEPISPWYTDFLRYGEDTPAAPNEAEYADDLGSVMSAKLWCEEDPYCLGRVFLLRGDEEEEITANTFDARDFHFNSSDWLDWANAVSNSEDAPDAAAASERGVRVYNLSRSWYVEFFANWNYVYFSDVRLYVPVIPLSGGLGQEGLAQYITNTIYTAYNEEYLNSAKLQYQGKTAQEAAENYCAARQERWNNILQNASPCPPLYGAGSRVVLNEVAVDSFDEASGKATFHYTLTAYGELALAGGVRENEDGSHSVTMTQTLQQHSDGTWSAEKIS